MSGPRTVVWQRMLHALWQKSLETPLLERSTQRSSTALPPQTATGQIFYNPYLCLWVGAFRRNGLIF